MWSHDVISRPMHMAYPSSVAILMTGHKGSFWITAHEFTDLIKGACIGDNESVIVNKLY